jgi:hypothetical protein
MKPEHIPKQLMEHTPGGEDLLNIRSYAGKINLSYRRNELIDITGPLC